MQKKSYEKYLQSFDICIVCALSEEARAFLETAQELDVSTLRYQHSYCSIVLKNHKDEPLSLHISWPPRYGPQEMTLHLSQVLEECHPRIVIITGICAGDARQVQLGDLVVADRVFFSDSGKFTLDKDGRRIHKYDTLTYELDATILRFLLSM